MLKKTIITVIIVAVIALAGYYLGPLLNTNAEPQLLEYRVMRDDLTDWERDETFNEYQIVKSALEQDPENADFILRLGNIKKKIGDYRGAEHAWRRVIELNPINPIPANNLADLYANFLQDYQKAESYYLEAIEKSNTPARTVIYTRSLIDFYTYNTEQLDKAEALLQSAIEDFSGNKEFRILLARLYEGQGETDQAIAILEAGLEAFPDDPLLVNELDRLTAE